MPRAIGGLVAIKTFKVSIEFDYFTSRKTTHDLVGRNETLRRRVNFHAIASAQKQRLTATAALQHTIGFGVTREILARFHVRVVMANTDTKQIQGLCLIALTAIPQRSANASLTPMMHSAATRFGANHRKCRPCKISP